MPPKRTSAKEVQTPRTERTTRSRGNVQIDLSDYSAVSRPTRASSRLSDTSSTTDVNNGGAAAGHAPSNLDPIPEQTVDSDSGSSRNSQTNLEARTTRPHVSETRVDRREASERPTSQTSNGSDHDRAARGGSRNARDPIQTPTPMSSTNQQNRAGTFLTAHRGSNAFVPNTTGRVQSNRTSAEPPRHRPTRAFQSPSHRATSIDNAGSLDLFTRDSPHRSSSGASHISWRTADSHASSARHNSNDDRNNNDSQNDDVGNNHHQNGANVNSSDNLGNSSDGSLGGTPMNPAPVPQPQTFLSFMQEFWKKVKDGFQYLKKPHALFLMPFAFFVMVLQLCSAGDLCKQNPRSFVVLQAFREDFWRYIGLWISLFLTFAGLWDLLRGVCETIYDVLNREQHQRRISKTFLHRCVVPVLIVVIMFSLPSWREDALVGSWPRPFQFVCVNGATHLAKWYLEAAYAIFGPLAALGHRAGYPFMLLLVLGCIVLVLGAYYQSHFGNDWAAAIRYWNGNRKAAEGQSIFIQNLTSYPAQSMSRILTHVTHETITKWIQPTSNL